MSEFKVISVTFIPSNSNFADTKAIFNYFMEMFKKEVEISFVVGSKCQDYFEVHTKNMNILVQKIATCRDCK